MSGKFGGLGGEKKTLMEIANNHDREKDDVLKPTTQGKSVDDTKIEVSASPSMVKLDKVEASPKTPSKVDENAENLTLNADGTVVFHRTFGTVRRAGMPYRHHNTLVPFSIDKELKRIMIEHDLSMSELTNLLFVDLIEKGQLPTKLLKQYKKETAKGK